MGDRITIEDLDSKGVSILVEAVIAGDVECSLDEIDSLVRQIELRATAAGLSRAGTSAERRRRKAACVYLGQCAWHLKKHLAQLRVSEDHAARRAARTRRHEESMAVSRDNKLKAFMWALDQLVADPASDASMTIAAATRSRKCGLIVDLWERDANNACAGGA